MRQRQYVIQKRKTFKILYDNLNEIWIYENETKFCFLSHGSIQIKTAEIIVACLGKSKFIKGSWLKENAIVIDCGITPIKGIYVSCSILSSYLFYYDRR